MGRLQVIAAYNEKGLKDAAGGVRFNLYQEQKTRFRAFGDRFITRKVWTVHFDEDRMAQLTKSNIDQSPQNKPEASLTEMDIRLAGQIGRQLAVIGDEINQHYHETFQSIRLHRTHTATRVYGSSSIIAQRRPFFFHKGIKAIFGTIKRYLMNSVQYPIIQRSRVWVANVCPSNDYIKWTAGFLAVFLLGVAIGIDL